MLIQPKSAREFVGKWWGRRAKMGLRRKEEPPARLRAALAGSAAGVAAPRACRPRPNRGARPAPGVSPRGRLPSPAPSGALSPRGRRGGPSARRRGLRGRADSPGPRRGGEPASRRGWRPVVTRRASSRRDAAGGGPRTPAPPG